MSGTSPTQRSLEWARNQGWLADVCEHWQPSFANAKVVDAAKDLFQRDILSSVNELRRAVAQSRIKDATWGITTEQAREAVIQAACHIADDVAGLARLNALFASVEQLERSGPGRRQDLFEFIDILAIGGAKLIGIQTTATSGQTARVKKIKTECADAAKAWLETGSRILVIGWKKYAQPVDRRYWRETVRELTLEDLST